MSLVVQLLFKDYMKTFLFLLICTSVDVIITFYSLYRGYAISSLLFSYIFFLIHKKKKLFKKFKVYLSYFICFSFSQSIDFIFSNTNFISYHLGLIKVTN